MKEMRTYMTNALHGVYSPEETDCLIRLIGEYVLSRPYHQIRTDENILLTTDKKEQIREITERLARCEPIQYVLGEGFFYGLSFEVNHSTLIPRPETEELVDLVISDHKSQPAISVLDIGTGSGCIAIVLAKYLKDSKVTGIDISREALDIAGKNASVHQVKNVQFEQLDILSTNDLSSFSASPFDCIVSNPPYVMEKERKAMDRNVTFYEPEEALFVPDNDPLLFYRHIALLGKNLLKTGGSIYFEINAQCGKEMIGLMEETGYSSIRLIRDLSGNDRIIKAIR